MIYPEITLIKTLIQTHLKNKNIKEAISLSQKLLSEFPHDEELPQILSNKFILHQIKPINWQAWWVIAQAAKIFGDTKLVDKACSIILKEQPDFWFARELPKHARGFYAQMDNDLVIFKHELKQDKLPVRLYYIPNGDDYHIAELLRDTFVEVKPFGCTDVQDYIDRRILAYKTPDASRIMYEEVRHMHPHIVYLESGYNIDPEMLQRVRKELHIPVVMWFGDACVNQQFVERILHYAQFVDWQIDVDRRVSEEARRRGILNVEFIPFFGYDHYFHPLNSDKTDDILFSGKSYAGTFETYPFAQERLSFILDVNDAFGPRMKVIGQGWDQYNLANYYNQRVPEWEINNFNNKSKIVLAFDAVQVEDFTSCRIYNALLGKSFIVTRKYPGIEKYFVNWEHLVWFEDRKEGISLLRHFLDNTKEREQIAEQGYEHILRNGWKFSNVVKYLVNRCLKNEERSFEQIFAPYSHNLPQKNRHSIELIKGSSSSLHAIKVSAIVSAYNAERFLRGCLEDLIHQTLYISGELEIIVIDSNSQQNEKAIVEEFQQSYENIEYICTEERETVYAAWNRGIKAAKGKYITNANADDRHRKDALEYMGSILDQNPDIGLVYPDVIITATENETFEHHTPVGAYRWLDYSRELLTLGCFVGPQPMWHRSLHDTYGYFDESFFSSGDWEFWLRISQSANMLHIPEFLGLYYFSQESAEHRDPEQKIKEDMRVLNKYIPKYLSTVDDIDRGITTIQQLEQKCGDSRPFAGMKNDLIQMKSRFLRNQYKSSALSNVTDTAGKSAVSDALPDASVSESDKNTEILFKEPTKGSVSIIVLCLNQIDSIKKCIQSIRKYTPEKYEIIFVPVDPAPATVKHIRKFLKENQNYKLIENICKLTYPEAFNKGIAEAKGEYIVVLSDDVVVTEGWLTGMLECINSASDIGIVGPMTVNVDGPQGVGGIAALPSPVCDYNVQAFAGAFRERNRYRRIETTNLYDFCLLFKKDLVKKLGLMDERLEIHDFANNDYCLRAASEGYRNIIAGDVFIHSRRNRTLAERQGEFGSNLTRISKIFTEKWDSLDTSTAAGRRIFSLNILSQANELRQMGRQKNAIEVILKGLEYATYEKSLYFTLAEFLIEDKKFMVALAILEKMPAELKQDIKGLELTGYCKERLNLFEEAEQYADKALALNKVSAKALNLKGMLSSKKGLPDSAEQYFNRSIESDKSYAEAYHQLGILKLKTGNKEDAFSLFERAFILCPHREDIIIDYHTAAVSLSRLEEAENIVKDAAALYPLNKKLRHLLADIYCQQKKYDSAMNILEETLIECGMDDDTLSFALKVREKIGAKGIHKDVEKDFKNTPLEKGDKGGCKTFNEEKERNNPLTPFIKGELQPPAPPFLRGKLQTSASLDPGTLASSNPASISLCMIVKNEEQNIARCLNSMKTLADEMIVVDTGSADRTKDIAKAFGAKVFDFAWTNDFAEARNFSLSKALGTWIFVLDADETISSSDHISLKELISKTGSGPAAYSFTTRNYIYHINMNWKANDWRYLEEEAGTGWIPSQKVRLFSNNPLIRFVNPVHELVEESLIRSGIEIRKTDVPVHHYGKLDGNKEKIKAEDYYLLGRKKLEDKGVLDLHALYELAVQAMELERYEEALGYWEKLTTLKTDFSRAFLGLGNAYFQLGRYQEAVTSLKTAFELEPDSRDIITLYARCLIFAGNVETSIPLLEISLGKDPMYPPSIGLLAVAHFCSNRKKEGFFYTKKLNETNFSVTNFFSDFTGKLIKAKRFQYAISILEAVIEGKYMTNETVRLLDEAKGKLIKGELQPPAPPLLRGNLQTSPSPSSLDYQTIEPSNPCSISLCMIVKNEEDNIERCLSGIKPVVDEIIMVDTGSSDRTREIAKAFGAKVCDFKWNDSFADARTFCMSKATGTWILILDADEVISPSDHESLRKMVEYSPLEKGEKGGCESPKEKNNKQPPTPPFLRGNKDNTAYSFVTRNYVNEVNTVGWTANTGAYPKEEDGTGWFPGEKVRLFPNFSGIYFENAVHERIEPALSKFGVEIRKCDIPVHHYGTLDQERTSAKSKYYYSLGKKRLIEKGSADVTAMYDLAVEAAANQYYEEALEFLQKIIRLKPDFVNAYESMGNIYYNLGRYGDALSSYDNAMRMSAVSRDIIVYYGICQMFEGNIEASISKLEELLQKEPGYPPAMTALAMFRFFTGEKEKGAVYVKELRSMNFDCANYFGFFAKRLLAAGKLEYAISLLEAAIENAVTGKIITSLLAECYSMRQ